jgi:hypothetical protein
VYLAEVLLGYGDVSICVNKRLLTVVKGTYIFCHFAVYCLCCVFSLPLPIPSQYTYNL